MGAPKQKWTPEEEAALRAGVEKYGPGKWRTIQKDPVVGPILKARSNVDLKDKWRNMNVVSGGHGSREKSLKTLRSTSENATDEPIPAVPLASLPGDNSTEDTYLQADGSLFIEGSKDRKFPGPRYENLILEALLEVKDPNGSTACAIANYIEEHHAVPSSFRRSLSSKLRDLTVQGKLIKSNQSYKVIDSEQLSTKFEMTLQKEAEDKHTTSRDALKKMRGVMKPSDFETLSKKCVHDGSKANFKFVGEANPACEYAEKTRIGAELQRPRLKTLAEAARAAALAVAEAEAAAAALEQAAKEAEEAEAEADAAEMAAKLAALAAQPLKKGMMALHLSSIEQGD